MCNYMYILKVYFFSLSKQKFPMFFYTMQLIIKFPIGQVLKNYVTFCYEALNVYQIFICNCITIISWQYLFHITGEIWSPRQNKCQFPQICLRSNLWCQIQSWNKPILHSSKKVTQHDCDRLYFYHLGFLFIKLDIPRKLVYLPFHWCPIC